MVMQPTAHFLVGGSNPGPANMAALPTTVDRLGFGSPAIQLCSRLRYHATRICNVSTEHPHCLEPSEHKLLTPPLKKVISSFRG